MKDYIKELDQKNVYGKPKDSYAIHLFLDFFLELFHMKEWLLNTVINLWWIIPLVNQPTKNMKTKVLFFLSESSNKLYWVSMQGKKES